MLHIVFHVWKYFLSVKVNISQYKSKNSIDNFGLYPKIVPTKLRLGGFMIERILKKVVQNNFLKGKGIIITGPRQSGKTTLLQMIRNELNYKSIFLNCDEPDTREVLTNVTSTQLKELIGNAEFVFIDEAQRVKNIGITLKLIIDQIPDKQLIVTGSSSLELANVINEPLTGRKFEYLLLPLSKQELVNFNGKIEEKRLLEERLIFGMYPDVILKKEDRVEILKTLTDSYLYKDIFSFQDVRKPELINLLLEALALQIGSEVSYYELSRLLGVDFSTIIRYISLLEKCFVIFRLRSFSRNLRNELKKSRKIYFYDNGVRNALINNLNPLKLRSDTGALWENFLMSERIKYNNFNKIYAKMYFWRTKHKQEIDLLEEKEGKLFAYEFKWNPNKKFKFTPSFINAYPDSERSIITKENYLDFIT